MSLEEQRRARFEAIVAEHYYLKELPLNRHDGEYAESELQMAWEVFEATLDSVVVALPPALADDMTLIAAIEAAGLRVTP